MPVQTFLSQARATLVPPRSAPYGPLPPMLLALTLVTGLVDAFSYLALGRVFVANMTGNVVFMAFSLAGASGFSVTASVLALAAFAAGALAGGRLGHAMPGHRARLLLTGTVLQAALVAAACVTGALVGLPATGAPRGALIVLLGVAMGGQNAVVRQLGVPDLTTTVLTMTITGMAADSRLAGGASGKGAVRLLSALAMFLGALAGAALIGHGHTDVPLLCGVVLLAAVAAALAPHRAATGGWTGGEISGRV
ncbi:YoaK family protein [Streptomyces sp. V4-01]|uniref:YoaK family protein n=1 Tax=Actinacidiphila polyblastidii TaxID=3110430 RepID=A0ABU7PHQ1_9ACTN|nr:YoaK family protein [Streptomyces sp. V4-01]